MIYYAEGNFMSRKGIDQYDISMHPYGLPHGPQPGMTEASIGKKETNELAVMVDTFYPLHLTQQAVPTGEARIHGQLAGGQRRMTQLADQNTP